MCFCYLSIPRSVLYNSTEYVVTTIHKDAFKLSGLMSIQFPVNSEIRTIGNGACFKTPIYQLEIPPSLFKIDEIAFYHCFNLKRVIIPKNSELEIIGNAAFSTTLIESFTIPSSLKIIGERAFENCRNLRKIEIPTNSKLESIGNSSLIGTKIREFLIPESLVHLKEGWCAAAKLTKITIMPKNPRYSFFNSKFIIGKSSIQNPNYDVLVFCSRNVKHVTVPNFIKRISSYAFYCCNRIRKIFIQPNITHIGERAFMQCHKLRMIEIPENSKLQRIDKGAFSFTSIKCFFIPKNATQIDSSIFYYCKHLIVELDENSKIEFIDPIEQFGCFEALLMIPAKLKICINTNSDSSESL